MVLATNRKIVLPDSYYDDTDLDNLYEIPIALENPTREQRKDIEFHKTIYRGVMLTTGKARSGKDLFGTTTAKLHKVYFDRPILLDFKPKRLFGYYIPFDPILMVKEINKMAKLSKFKSDDVDEPMSDDESKYFTNYTEEWVNKKEVLFKNAFMYLMELKRYCYNRNPHSRVNKAVGSLCTFFGHLDMLIFGTHVNKHEIDQYSFLDNVTHWAKCKWSISELNTTNVKIFRGSFITEQGNFDVALEPVRYKVNGKTPRTWLDGDCCYNLYNTKNMLNLQPALSKETGG